MNQHPDLLLMDDDEARLELMYVDRRMRKKKRNN